MSTLTQEMLSLYGTGFAKFGDDPKALFHNDRDSQHERFRLLARLFEHETKPFTVHEIGCSTGHFGEFLRENYPLAEFSGSDINSRFIEICSAKFGQGRFFLRDISESESEDRYDYVVTCLFNLPGATPRAEWQQFMQRMLRSMYAISTKGIATTYLTTYYDPGRNREDLYYQDEKKILDFAVSTLSRHVALVATGPLYEYALHVYHPEYIHTRYPQSSFGKYFKGS